MDTMLSLFISLIVPLVMVVFGLIAMRGGPRKVNIWYGYRTPMASKNQDTWVFAHKYVGRLMLPMGIVLILVSVGTIFLRDHGTVPGTLPGVLALIGVAMVIILIFPTEMALRRTFDKNGNRLAV